MFIGSRRRRVHRVHPRRGRARSGPGRRDHRRRLPHHRLLGATVDGTDSSTSTGTSSAAEKGGYEYFMLKEIAEQPAAVADTLLGHFVDGRIVLDEQRLDPTRSCARSTRSSWSRAAPPTTPACWPSTRSSTGRDCPSRSRWPVSSATATRCWTAARSSSRSASPARPPTRWRPCGTPRSRRPRCWRSATPTAARSRASPTPCSTPTPARRSASRPPRRSSRRSPPTTSSVWRWRRRAARSTPTRSPASTTSSRRCRQLVSRSARPRSNRSRSWRASSRRRRRCCSSAATSATRWRSRVR